MNAGSLVQKMPTPLRKGLRRQVVAIKARLRRRPPAPPRRPPYDAHRFAYELRSNPLFTDDGSTLRAAEAAQAEPGQRHLRMDEVNLTLRAVEVESIRRHGIVRLEPEKICAGPAPTAQVAFATVTNDKYAPGVEALLLSLLRQYPGFESDVIVFHDETLSATSRGRLQRIYPGVRFEQRATEQYDVGQIGDSVNHRRVGLLGYLSIEVLALTGYQRVVLLDADTVVINDISRLWQGDRIQVVADHGVLPFGLIAQATGRPVINSGMISLPGPALGPAAHQRAMQVLARVTDPVDVLLDNFADQKFWNVFLADHDVEFVPVNYNTNKALVDRHFPDLLADAALLHMTGPKPWYDFSDQDLVTEDDHARLKDARGGSRATFAVWNQLYFSQITSSRMRSFRTECGPDLAQLRGSAPRPALMIGNGPSLRHTDLAAFAGFETFVFNWFVHHDDFDAVAPDHLVLASHMFYGGWHTTRPQIPAEFLAALRRHRHRPRIWTSYYFKDAIEDEPALRDYQVSYLLFEKPFKVPVSRRGAVGLDLLSPLTDANTGVLTAGIPIALHLGSDTVVLVGCDSDYSSASGSYFYDAAAHTSRTTDEQQLVNTWQEQGAGQFGYQRMAQELTARGVQLIDATVGGKLTVLPRLSVPQAAALAAASTPAPSTLADAPVIDAVGSADRVAAEAE